MLQISITLLIVGCSCTDWSTVDALMKEAISERAFPGAILTVASQNATIYRKTYGGLTYSNMLYDARVSNSTLYDIASITKIMATTFAVMNQYSSKFMALTDPITKWFKNYDVNRKGNTTVASLLLHNSGQKFDYPSALPNTTQDIIDYIVFAKPDFTPGTKFQYSDLGFILLAQIVALASKQSFDQYVRQNNIFAGLSSTRYNPPESDWYRVAPCQYDPETRKRTIRGEAHDRLAYFFGGIGGHSGLFTSADDVTRFMRLMLNKGKMPNESRVISESVVDLFTTRVNVSYPSTRAYGFDTDCPGSKMQNCFGHNGYTGTMAWADKDNKLVVTLLTNRVHPYANNNKIEQYKDKIVDSIYEALGY